MTTPNEFRGQTLSDLANPLLAERYLAHLLLRGELALLLGAGVSMANSLPSWKNLVRTCEAEVGIVSPAASAELDLRGSSELMAAMEAVAARLTGRPEFLALVKRCLYAGADVVDGTYADTVLGSRLLIAIGALVMPSRRGSIHDVVTLNFDDLLEWYLHLHGYRTQSIANLPRYLRSDVDVTIYHPHGFLPLVKNQVETDWIVLRHADYVARLANSDGHSWGRHMTALFASKRLLAVGSSMGDIDIDVQLATARREHSNDSLPAGFVIGTSIEEIKRKQLLDAGLVPVSLASRDEIPTFLLRICRQAAELSGEALQPN